MSNQNEKPTSMNDDQDVAQAYRLVADESVPGHLDEAVLIRAKRASAARSRWFSASTWIRPTAFAATAGLSLAIVLEISETNVFDTVQDNTPTPSGIYSPPAGGSDRAQSRTDAPARAEREALTPRPAQMDAAEPAVPMGKNARDTSRKSSAEDAAVEAVAQPAAASQPQTPANVLPNQEVAAPATLATSEMQALSQQGAEAPAAGRVSSGAADRYAPIVQPERFCSDEQVRNADSWWQCIEELRAANRLEAAQFEQALLVQAFPDQLPDQ